MSRKTGEEKSQLLGRFKSNDQGIGKGETVLLQREYLFEEVDLKRLNKQIESRKRFSSVTDLVERLRGIDDKEARYLKHIYLIEGYNKQDCLAAMYYICGSLMEMGIYKGQKIVDVTTECMVYVNWCGITDLPSNRKENEDAVCMYLSLYDCDLETDIRVDFDKLQSGGQFPIFILIDREGQQNSLKNKSISEILFGNKLGAEKLGVVAIDISPVTAQEMALYFQDYVYYNGINIDESIDLKEMLGELNENKMIVGECDIVDMADALIENLLIENRLDRIIIERDFIEYNERINRCEEGYLDKLDKVINLVRESMRASGWKI